MNKLTIGFFAHIGDNALCEGNALVVMNKKKQLKKYLVAIANSQMTKVSLHDLLAGLDAGGVYCLDEPAFQLFEEYANLHYFNISSHTDQKGIELYTISLGEMMLFSS